MRRRSFIRLASACLTLQALPSFGLEAEHASGHGTATPGYGAVKHGVSNRGIPPDDFLDQLVAWGRTAPDALFTPNTQRDVYASVKGVLGPWSSTLQRKASMLEVMRVLAGFESSWNWNEGRDVSNPSSVTPETIEAGAWQVSADSIHFGTDLRELVLQNVGSLDGDAFQRVTKQNHTFAMEYIVRLLRITVNHNGPVKRHEIDPYLRRDAAEEFQRLLA